MHFLHYTLLELLCQYSHGYRHYLRYILEFYRPDVGLETGSKSRTRRLIGIVAQSAIESGTGSILAIRSSIFSYAAFSSTCDLAGNIPSHSITAFNSFPRACCLLETSGEKALDVSSPHFGQYTHIHLGLELRLRLQLGGGASDIRFDVRADVDVSIFGLGLTLMERIWRMIGACLCGFGTIK